MRTACVGCLATAVERRRWCLLLIGNLEVHGNYSSRRRKPQLSTPPDYPFRFPTYDTRAGAAG